MILLPAMVTSMTERSRLQIQEAKMSFFCGVRSSVPQEGIEVEPLLPQTERGPGYLLDAPLKRCFRHVPPGASLW